MYEERFGICGPPFQLSPDPSFYFHSRSHARAMVDLRRGFEEESKLVVVSGDVGTGKTMLVRTLLDQAASAGPRVAHVVSTQLDAANLFRATLAGFGLQADSADEDELALQLLYFLVSLNGGGGRAVVVIDEAQNLHREAFVRLVAFVEQGVLLRLRLQVYLVGQPGLRTIIETGEVPSLSRLVDLSCQISSLERDETRAYIEHRLRKVGWSGSPSFEEASFEEIHRWTDGVPRRINLLCNRLLLSCFLGTSSRVSAPEVIQSARELVGEIGAWESANLALVDLMTWNTTHIDAEASSPMPSAAATRREAAQPGTVGEGSCSASGVEDSRPVLCLAAAAGDFLDAATLMDAMARQPGARQAILVRVFRKDKEEHTRAAFGDDVATLSVQDVDLGTSARRVHGGELRDRFVALCKEARPSAVVVFRTTDASIVCSIVARQRRVPVVAVGDAARERRKCRLRDEMAKKLWAALQG